MVSNNFVVGAPAVVPQPQITVTPTSDIDPSVKNVFTVNGAGYVGTSASKGIYVVVADPAVWTPGKTPTPSATARFAGQVWVKPEQIVNGVFTAKVEVPAGKFDPKKSYVVGTMAAHELAISDRSMDTGKAISFASSGQPEATPKPEAKQPEAKPKPESTQPEGTPKPEAKQPETKQPEATQPEAKQLQTKPQPEVMSAKVDSSKVVTPAKKLAFTGAQAMTLFVASLVMVILGPRSSSFAGYADRFPYGAPRVPARSTIPILCICAIGGDFDDRFRHRRSSPSAVPLLPANPRSAALIHTSDLRAGLVL